MARLVEAVKCAEIISEKFNIPLADLVDVFADIPTADVAPKSEVDDLQDALKCEKETNKHLNDEYIDLMRENEKLTINMNAYGLAAKTLKEEKDALAREIFEEIRREIKEALKSNYDVLKTYDDGRANEYILELVNRVKGKIDALRGIDYFIDELEEKYTEEKE